MIERHTIEELTQRLLEFRDRRDWKQFHNPKDQALSLLLEVAELIELMQWRNSDELAAHLRRNRRRVGEELSDVLGWVLLLAHDLEIDLDKAFLTKLRHNARKYPVHKAKGSARKYTEL